jgi:hypothetical protein
VEEGKAHSSIPAAACFFIQLHSFFDHFLALHLHVFSEQSHIIFRVQFLALRGILQFSCTRNPAVTIREIHRIIIRTSNNSHYEWMPLSAQILCGTQSPTY